MPQTLTRIATTALLALAAAWANAQAGDWGDVTIVSGTVGNNPNRLCMGVPDYMRPADIGCPSYAPSLSTAGHVSITGNVSAQKFIGDGSGITNLNVQGDRIVSGTTQAIANNGGNIEFKTGSTVTGWYSPAGILASVGVSTTNRISASDLFVGGNVGIGTASPATELEVRGNGGDGASRLTFSDPSTSTNTAYVEYKYTLNNGGNLRIGTVGSGSGFGNIDFASASGFRVDVGNGTGGYAILARGSGLPGFRSVVSINNPYPPSIPGLVISGSLIVSSTVTDANPALYVGTNGNVGIGTATPGEALSLMNGNILLGDSANAERLILMRRNSADIGKLSTLSSRLTLKGLANHDVSIEDDSGNGLIVKDGGSVGIGTTNPNAKLDVIGLISASNIYVISTAAGEGVVSGTYGYFRYISGTQVYGTFVGDGSGLTGVTAGSADRIVSGSTGGTRMVAISDTGYISVTQGGYNTAYFHPSLGFVAVGVSSTGPISGTSGYFRGNVGVGTTSPVSRLQLAGSLATRTIGTEDLLVLERPFNSGVEFGRLAAFALGSANTSSNGMARLDVRLNPAGAGIPANPATLSTVATVMSMQGDGNVGIGTTAPNAPLHVSATGTGALFKVQRDGGSNGGFNIDFSGQSANLDSTLSDMAFKVAGSEKMRIDAFSGGLQIGSTANLAAGTGLSVMGNVGIGTADPSNTMHIKGTGWGANSPTILIQTNGVAFQGLGLYDDATFAGVQSSQRTLFLSSRNTNNLVWLRSYWGGLEANQYWGYGGTLIAGAMPSSGAPGSHTQPSTTLHVSGTIRIADGGEACDGDRAGAIRYTSSSVFEFCKGSGWESMAVAAGGSQGDRIVSGTTRVLASEDRSVTVRTAGNDRVLIGENGFVGIGTSTPKYLLSVNGAGRFDSGVITPKVNPLVDGVSAFQINNAGNTQIIFGVDTTNRRIGIAIGEGAPSATLHVSGTIKVAGTGAEACDANMRGGMRRNPSSGLMELCQ